MEPMTLIALHASIAKWESHLTEGTPGRILLGADACPLCNLFNTVELTSKNKQCFGCPIYERTKKPVCRNTPYSKASLALTTWQWEPDNSTLRDKFRASAQKEVDFLKSLLPGELG